MKSSKFNVDGFIVDPLANSLSFHNQTKGRRIEPKLMTLLCYLSSNAGEVITRETIASKVWPGVVIGDEAINRAVFALRNLLSDDAKNPKYIETIPKRGYRFLAEVNDIKNTSVPIIRFHTFKYIVFTIISLCLLALLLKTSFLYFSNNNWQVEKSTTITSFAGSEFEISFHKPSGKSVFTRQVNGQTNLFSLNINDDKVTQLTDDNWRKIAPGWIDENTLIYLRCNDHKCQIVRQKGNVEVLFETSNVIYSLSNFDKKSNQVFFNRSISSNQVEVFSLNLTSKKVTLLRDMYTNLPLISGYLHYNVDQNTLYLVGFFEQEKRLMSLNLNTGDINEVTREFSQYRNYSVYNNQLFLAADKGAQNGLWRINLNSKVITPVLMSTGDEIIAGAKYNQEEHALYYESNKIHDDILQINSSGIHTKIETGIRARITAAAYVRNKDSAYYVSYDNGIYQLWTHDLTAEKAKKLVEIEASNLYPPLISNDGSHIAIVYNTNVLQLAIIDAKSGRFINKRTLQTPISLLAWSKDDKSIYISEENSTISLVDAKTLDSTLLNTNAGLSVIENSNGDSYYFVDFEKKAVILQHKKSNIQKLVMKMDVNIQSLKNSQLCIKESSAFVVQETNGIHELIKFTFDQSLPPIKNKITIPNLAKLADISADGQHMLFIKTRDPSSDILKINFSK